MILQAFEKKGEAENAIKATLAKDSTKTLSDSYIEIYKRLRDT